MQLTSEGLGTDQPATGKMTTYRPCCPVCSGPLIELRSAMRCSRCYFSICEGCAGEPADAYAASEE
jgi:hypothetical protein